MSNFTRGEFLKLATVLGAGAAASGCEGQLAGGAGGVEGSAPDLVLVNGRVYTVDDQVPRAEAFAVKGGRFLAVGTTDDVQAMAVRGTTVIDAEGMTVVPGFIDAHCHPSGVRDLYDVNLEQAKTIRDIKEALSRKAAETQPNYWVNGFMYDDTKITDESGQYRRVNRFDLDEAVPNHPVQISHRGGHIAWFNTKAFEMAGVRRDVADPPGGRFDRDANGELTGLVEERATRVFNGVGNRREITRADQQAGVRVISERMTASGLTSVHQTGGDTQSLLALQDAYHAGEMRFRMYFFPSGGSEAFAGMKAASIRTGFGDEWLRIGAVKYGADGSISGRTARMSQPYVGRPNDYGILTMTQQDINEAVEDARLHDFQIGIHANGDVTIDMCLTAYEQVLQRYPHPDPRYRLEHCTLINPDLVRRIAAIGAIPTPFWTYVYYHGEKWAEYGQERTRSMFAHRTFLDAGIRVPGASDYGPGPFQPLMAIQSMVTRKDWKGTVWGENQRVTVDEAIRIGTLHGAYASFEENLKGSITPGKLADFVILGEDPHDVDPDQIINIPVVRTVVGGRTMHPIEAV
ncbi:MAG: amidohydrolase family protein [Gemmatimonadetes bacterium]|nr:amidohydrolase family protein [Gemmatimonadota bacterium]